MELREKEYLRDLAKQVLEYSKTDCNIEKEVAWQQHNDLVAGSRPMVVCDPENGWNEIIPQTDLKCVDAFARYMEMTLLKDIFSFTKLKDDRVLESKFYTNIAYASTGWGLEAKHTSSGENGAYHIEPALTDYAMLSQIHMPIITFDEEETRKGEELTREVFDGILDVERKGTYWWSLGISNTAIDFRGLENFMLDMYDYPDEMHAYMNMLCEGNLQMLNQLEKQNMLYQNNGNCYVGSGGYGFTKDLKSVARGAAVTPKDMWGFTESQETASVSTVMFEEFVFPYQLKIASRFGLNCYGCCEGLEKRWDIVKRIPNLRRVSVSHWADAKLMAEYLNSKYVYSLKPSPSFLASRNMDANSCKAELAEKIGYAKKNNCHIEVIMKDNHTLGGNPQNAIDWVQIARNKLED